jgi:hypothetical protein
MLSWLFSSVTVAGVTTSMVPMAPDRSWHWAPGTPGVLIAMVWVVPLTIVAHDGSASSARSAPKTMRTVEIPPT